MGSRSGSASLIRLCSSSSLRSYNAGAVAYGGYKAVQALNARDDGYFPATDYANYISKSDVDCEEKGKKDGAPKSREAQQKQADDAKKEIERKLGRTLTPQEKRQFHDHITGQDYNYHELVEEGYWLFNGR